MHKDIQRAGMWQRIAAGILDMILLAILATGFCWLLSSILNYDQYFVQSENIRKQYTQQYNLPEEITQEILDEMSAEKYAQYEANVKAANEAIAQDEEAIRVFNMVMNLSLIIAAGGILLSMLLLQFVVPLLFGNGQTVGKKIFGLCLIRNDGVKLNPLQLFTRVILGKYAVGVMIPVYAVIMLMLNVPSLLLLLAAAVDVLAQIICFLVTRNHYLLHDLLAGTVVADYGSQRIFKSTEDLIAYQKKIAAERAARQDY